MLSEVISDSGEMLWLERNICHDERGYPYQEIRAFFSCPRCKKTKDLSRNMQAQGNSDLGGHESASA